MAPKLSRLTCPRCLEKGGFLTLRKAGNGINNSYYYIGHYDSSKSSRRRWCSLSRHELAHVEIDAPGYHTIYKQFINEFHRITHVPEDEEYSFHIYRELIRMLDCMGWPVRNKIMIHEKIQADLEELHVLEMLGELETTDHNIYAEYLRNGISRSWKNRYLNALESRPQKQFHGKRNS